MREITHEEFKELTENNSKFLLLFCGDNCIKCKTLIPELESVEGLMKFPLYKLNAEQNPEIATKFGITSLPYIILFQGSEVLKTFDDVATGKYLIGYFDI